MDIIECPAPGESEADPYFPPHQAGVLAVFARVIGCPSLGEQPSHAIAVPLLYRQADRHGAAAKETFTFESSTHGSEVATYTAIPCGWSASQGSRPSPLPQAVHRAGHTHLRPGSHSSCRQTQYRADLACLRGRLHFLLHRWAARLIVCLLRRVYLGPPV